MDFKIYRVLNKNISESRVCFLEKLMKINTNTNILCNHLNLVLYQHIFITISVQFFFSARTAKMERKQLKKVSFTNAKFLSVSVYILTGTTIGSENQ